MDMRHKEEIADGQMQDLRDEAVEYPQEKLLTAIRGAAGRIRHRIRNAARHRRKRPSEMYTERSRDR